MPYKVKGRQGEELCCYVPDGTIARVDQARGKYFTRSKFVLYALDRAIEEANSGVLRFDHNVENNKRTPQGAQVLSSQAPSGQAVGVASNKEPNQEDLAQIQQEA